MIGKIFLHFAVFNGICSECLVDVPCPGYKRLTLQWLCFTVELYIPALVTLADMERQLYGVQYKR
jgi:hypothetical protein